VAARAAAAEAAAAATAEAAAADAENRKTRAKEAWLTAVEPAAGPGVVSVALRFADGAFSKALLAAKRAFTPLTRMPARTAAAGTRVTRRFEAGTKLLTLFEAAAALGPLAIDAPFSLATGFPRRVLARPAGGEGDTLEACGVEGGVMVVPVD
jgi:hypothetical protein